MLPEPFGRWWRAALSTPAPREALCSTVAAAIVVGWTYDTNAAFTKCATPTCVVQDEDAQQFGCNDFEHPMDCKMTAWFRR